jgi:ABC-type glycerol-3-phosphate transport system substrate-binding protein
MASFGIDDSAAQGKLTRRQLVKGSAAVAGAAAAAAALPALGRRTTSAQSKSKLTVGVYAYVPQGIPFDQVVKNYTDKYPNVEISVQPMGIDITSDSGAFVQRMAAEKQAKRSSYDLIIGPTTWIEVAPLAQLGAIEPIASYVPQSLIDDLYDPVRKGVTYKDGKIYSMPWWADVVGFMYRKSMLQKAVGSDTPPKTWDDVLTYCEKLKAAEPKIAAYGADWPQAHRLLLPILAATTDNTYDENGVWNVEDPAYLDALKLIQKLEPYMPASSQEDLGSSKAFQAGQVAMATYWPTQVLRAIQAGQPADDIAMSANPQGTKSGTLFWNADVIIPSFSANKEEAGRFMNEALLSDFTVEKSYENWKIVPYKSIYEKRKGTLPDWVAPLLEPLSTGAPIPMNPYYLGFELPIYKEEVEKMILQGQSPEDTQKNLASRIKEAYQETAG